MTWRAGRSFARLGSLAGMIGILLLVAGCGQGGDEDGLPQGGGGGGGAGGCDWRRYAGEIDSSYANKFDLPSYQAAKLPDGTAKPGDFYWVECGSSTELLYVPDSDPVVDPLLMAEYAANFIRGARPTIHVNPGKALVALPTWFWVGGGPRKSPRPRR